jgi:hypothetical protein
MLDAFDRHLAPYRLPLFTMEFRSAGDGIIRGCAERDGEDFRVLLRSDLGRRELAHVYSHECQHLIDMRDAGHWFRMEASEREERADTFARAVVDRFEDRNSMWSW